MSRRVIPKGLITNQPASDKGATWYRGVGALNRSVYRHLLINASLPQPFPPTTAPTIGNAVPSHLSLAFAITTPSQNAQYYEYSLDNGVNWTKYNLLDIGGEPYVLLTNLTNGQTYNITLRGVGRAGPGPASNVLTDTVNNQVSVQQFTTAGVYALPGPAKGTKVNYVLVGGGGGSGATYDNGTSGGGGGGMVIQNSFFIADGTAAYTLTVGAGGSGGGFVPASPQPIQQPGNPGQASSIIGGSISVSALGGLGGQPSRGSGAGGLQANPPNTAATGGNGGGGVPNNSAGGGGGAGGDGTDGTVGDGAVGGAGGVGLFVSLGGVTGTFGKGGNGASNTKTNVQGSSASPASGNGGNGSSAGSNSDINGANGGSGVVWVYY